MVCEKTPLLKHLAVHDPDALSTEPWRAHVHECAACHNEWRGFAASLAVYRHVEREDAARHSFRPSWEAYVRRLKEERAEHRRASVVTGTWLVGMVGLVLFGGAMSWGLWNDSGTHTGTALLLEGDSVPFEYPPEPPPVLSAMTPARETPQTVAGAVGGYGSMVSELRTLRRLRLLEHYTSPSGRPSVEMAIIPFTHQDGVPPHVMPVSSAPRSNLRLSYPNAPSFQGGYVLTSPVH